MSSIRKYLPVLLTTISCNIHVIKGTMVYSCTSDLKGKAIMQPSDVVKSNMSTSISWFWAHAYYKDPTMKPNHDP